MNTELIDISTTNKQIRIEVSSDEIRRVYDYVGGRYAKKAQVPGFRKGLAPIDVIHMRFGKEIKSDVLQEILSLKVKEAIHKHELKPLSDPQMHIDNLESMKVNGSQPLIVRIDVEIMPEIPPPDCTALEATRRVRPIKDEEIDNIIEEERYKQSAFLPVENRKSKNGDTVIVDLIGTFADDPKADPIEFKELEVKLGDELSEKDFSDNLVGLEAGDEKEFIIEYPKEFSSSEIAGKTLDYKAKVKSVGTVELPEINDKWVESLDQGVKTLVQFKKKLRGKMELVARSEADSRVRSDLIAELIENNEFEVPNMLIETQTQILTNNFARDMSRRGVNLQEMKKDFIENMFGIMRMQAEKDVREAILLEKVAEMEKIEIDRESVREKIEKMAEHYQTSIDEFRSSLDKQGGEAMIEGDLRREKAVEKLIEKANIIDAEWVDEDLQTTSPKPTE